MSDRTNPRHGSMQFWPRVRAARSYARIRNHRRQAKGVHLSGFAGYKVGMTHVLREDNQKHPSPKVKRFLNQ